MSVLPDLVKNHKFWPKTFLKYALRYLLDTVKLFLRKFLAVFFKSDRNKVFVSPCIFYDKVSKILPKYVLVLGYLATPSPVLPHCMFILGT